MSLNKQMSRDLAQALETIKRGDDIYTAAEKVRRTPTALRKAAQTRGDQQAMRMLDASNFRFRIASNMMHSDDRVNIVVNELDVGMSPREILVSLGVSASTVARAAYRAGRPDIVKLFAPIVWRDRMDRMNRMKQAA